MIEETIKAVKEVEQQAQDLVSAAYNQADDIKAEAEKDAKAILDKAKEEAKITLSLAEDKAREDGVKALEEAKKIVAAGVKYYIEVSNMPTTNEALAYLMAQENLIVAPSKAVNAGGVAVSGLEMSQNAMRLQWTPEEVDERLAAIMKNIHDQSAKCAEEYGYGYNLVAGANIFAFLKIADAMIAQGLV